MNLDGLLAQRIDNMESSVIREILKVVSEPGMISLAGGNPAPESFPLDIIRELSAAVVDTYQAAAFQYDLTEGFTPLRKALSTYLCNKGIPVTSEDIIIASGSQGILDAVGKMAISKGDHIAVEAPTYLGAIQAFTPYEPVFVSMDTDDGGLIPESLDYVLSSYRIKFVYVVSTFQNPTGRTIGIERRQAIAEVIKAHNALLIEDDPYSALRYCGSEIPAIKTFAPDNVIYLSTFSKIFAPGLRVGFCAVPEAVRKWLVIVKQGTDLHTSTFNQALAAEYLTRGYLETHLNKIISLYKPRQGAMISALSMFFPETFKWSCPDGGMFVWVKGPKGLDMEERYKEAVKKNVAFVPGRYFYTQDGQGKETMRLNFTMTDEAQIYKAVEILSDVMT